jgi:predicted RND superfamily exporter protein
MSAAEDHRVTRYVRWVVRWRWPIVIAVVAATALMAFGVRHLTFSNNYRVFFSPQNPQLRAFEDLERIYTKNDFIFFVIQPEDRNVFSRRVLTAIDVLTERSWKIPYSTRVDSLTNYQHTRAAGDDIEIGDLVKDPASLTDAQLEEIRQIATNDPVLRHRMVSPDGSITGVNVRLYPPGKSQSEIAEAVEAARHLAAQLRQEYPELRIEITGTAVLSRAFSEAPQKDMSFLLPLMYAFLTLAMFLFLRSFAGAVATLSVVALSAIGAVGLAGWHGVQLTGVSVSAPTIILTLAIADSVHILLTMVDLMQTRGMAKIEALVESMRINAVAVFLTSLTTVIGFLSLNFGDAPPLWDLGNITAVGVTLAWIYSMLFLPAAIAILPMRARQLGLNMSLPMDNLADFVIRRQRPLLIGMSAVALVLTLSVARFEINDKPVEYFSRHNPFRVATEFMVDNLTGFYGMNVSLPSGEPGGINDPAYLERVAAFVDWLRARDDVSHVDTITDTMKRLNQNMHGDDPAYYKLPTDRELSAQYLLLYEMSLPYGLDLNDRINVDKSATRLTISNTDVDFKHLKRFKSEAEQWLRENGSPAMRGAEGASPAVMFAYIAERNIGSMISGSVVAFALISITLMIALRSVKIGLISLIPNLVPIGMAFGLWALIWGSVDFAISIVAGVSIGIIVDDTIHFLAKYMRARREHGLSSAGAVRYAYHSVGNALWANSVILVVGFGALAFSAFWPNATMGLLTAICIAAALIADFLLLPPLLMWVDGDTREIT